MKETHASVDTPACNHAQGDGHLFTNGNVILGNAAADLITVNGVIQGASPLVFEGATVDASETTFAITDPTQDRTITFPDQSGNVVLATTTLTNGRIPYIASTQLTDSADMAYVPHLPRHYAGLVVLS